MFPTSQSRTGFPTGLAIRGNDVFVIGTFSGAGLADSSGIARWNETIDFTPPLTMSFSRTQPQPGNVFKSRLTCTERTTYMIQYSDDFQTWAPLLTNSVTLLDFTKRSAAIRNPPHLPRKRNSLIGRYPL